jgi:hypothetical protein
LVVKSAFGDTGKSYLHAWREYKAKSETVRVE